MTAPADAPVRAYIGLGANVGDAAATLAAAMRDIDALPSTVLAARSSLYRTPAWGVTDQPDFVNAVVAIDTRLAPRPLLDALLDIERRFGRDRGREAGRWGPRTLDLDLLLHGNAAFEEPGLTVPHPRIAERAFVLVPLAQIAPSLDIPGRGRVSDLLARVDATGIEAIP